MKLPPSAAAVYWLLKAHESTLRQYRTTTLADLSMLKESTFYAGLRTLKDLGLVREDSNSLHIISPEQITPEA